MAKKRKSDAAGLEEVDRTLYSAFSTAANSLSQLYTHATNHQKLSFQAGERHALEKLYQWILKHQEQESSLTNVDIMAYLQHELDYGIEEPSMSPRASHQQQLAQQPPSIHVHGARSSVSELQTRNMFTNVFSNPTRSSLQHYHPEACSGPKPNESSGNRETEPPPPVMNDSSMDMNADSPSYDSFWR